MKIVQRLSLSVLIAAASIFLTCENNLNLLEEIETEVGLANEKFLIITASYPQNNAGQISPSLSIELEFDRDLLMGSVDTKSIIITGGSDTYEDFTAEFNSSSKILSITPIDILNASTEYSVTINDALKGADGSSMVDSYRFTFTTGELPAGDVWVNDSIGDLEKHSEEPELSDDSSVILFLDYNAFTTQFRYGEAEAGPFSAWIPITTSHPVTLTSGDAYYSFWLEFGDGEVGSPNNISEARMDGVIIDETPGFLEITSSFPSPILADSDPTLSLNAEISGAESGIKSYLWSASPDPGGNAAASFANAAQRDSTVAVSGQDTSSYGLTTLELTLTAIDGLDREFSDTVSISLDTIAPLPPVVSGSSPTLDPTPSWTWRSDGGGIDGSPSYQYQLNSTSGSWTASSATSVTWTSLSTGYYTLNVREEDSSGNWSSPGLKQIQVTAPSVTGPSYTLDQTPSWEWSSAADGTGAFHYRLNGGSWSSTTYSSSYTPGSALSDASHLLEIQEWNGSTWSNAAGKSILVTPVTPFDGQRNVSYYRGTRLAWRETGKLDYYTLQAKDSRGIFQTVVSGTSSESYTFSGLSGSTTYVWRIIVSPDIGRDYYYAGVDKGFSFTTAK